MGRAGIHYSHVAKAAAQLAADGKNPTVDSVREALGSTGSKSTIAPLLKRWKEEHQDAVVGTELGLPAELLLAMKGVYEKLQTDINQQLEQVNETHRIALQTATDLVRQLETDNRLLYEEKIGLSAELKQAQDALALLQVEHHSQSVTLATLQSDNAGLQQRLADRAAEVAALNQQQTQTRTQFEHYQEATAAQRAEERHAAEQRIARLEQDLSSAQQRLQGLQSTIAQQETELTHLRPENTHLKETARASQDELASTQLERNQLAYQFREITTTNQMLTSKFEAVQQELTESRMALAAQEKQTELLTERLVSAEDKAEKLDQEKLALFREVTSLQSTITHLEKTNLRNT
ncbi:chromosome partition protein Smc [mine drainage metagenome]|uniref:Chromosome partition protein Smc n=1 Tax=mine drainage metagenome TaxID=410659 RepID=A0A1J5SDR1_9ZZZZ